MPDRRLDRYRKVRSRMPPPERVEGDRRRELEEEEAEREIEEALRRPVPRPRNPKASRPDEGDGPGDGS
jgi:hypothetical protein